jgi:hypothetical protein
VISQSTFQKEKQMSRKVKNLFFVLVIASLILTACGGGGAAPQPAMRLKSARFDLTGATGDVARPF